MSDELLFARIIVRRWPDENWLLSRDVLAGLLWGTCPRLTLTECRAVIAEARCKLVDGRLAA